MTYFKHNITFNFNFKSKHNKVVKSSLQFQFAFLFCYLHDKYKIVHADTHVKNVMLHMDDNIQLHYYYIANDQYVHAICLGIRVTLIDFGLIDFVGIPQLEESVVQENRVATRSSSSSVAISMPLTCYILTQLFNEPINIQSLKVFCKIQRININTCRNLFLISTTKLV